MVNETTKPGNNGLSGIFRKQAIYSLNTLDHTEADLKIIPMNHWIIILSCLLALSALICWCGFGEIKFEIKSPGIVIASSELIKSEYRIRQKLNEKIENRNELKELYAKKSLLYKNHYLTRIDLLHAKQEYITAENELSEAENSLNMPFDSSKNDPAIIALSFVNYLDGKKIHTGMRANIELSSDSINSDNIANGKIIAVSSSPISKLIANTYLHNACLVDNYFEQGTPFMVKTQANNLKLQPGTPITVKIIYTSCTPLQLLMKIHHCG